MRCGRDWLLSLKNASRIGTADDRRERSMNTSALKSAIPTVTLPVRERFADATSRFRQMGSSFYATLSEGCMEDAEILTLASEAAPGQPATHLLFGAVQFLLFEQPDTP